MCQLAGQTETRARREGGAAGRAKEDTGRTAEDSVRPRRGLLCWLGGPQASVHLSLRAQAHQGPSRANVSSRPSSPRSKGGLVCLGRRGESPQEVLFVLERQWGWPEVSSGLPGALPWVGLQELSGEA